MPGQIDVWIHLGFESEPRQSTTYSHAGSPSWRRNFKPRNEIKRGEQKCLTTISMYTNIATF